MVQGMLILARVDAQAGAAGEGKDPAAGPGGCAAVVASTDGDAETPGRRRLPGAPRGRGAASRGRAGTSESPAPARGRGGAVHAEWAAALRDDRAAAADVAITGNPAAGGERELGQARQPVDAGRLPRKTRGRRRLRTGRARVVHGLQLWRDGETARRGTPEACTRLTITEHRPNRNGRRRPRRPVLRRRKRPRDPPPARGGRAATAAGRVRCRASAGRRRAARAAARWRPRPPGSAG